MRIGIWALVVGLLAFAFGSYFWYFHGSPSSKSEDWSNFSTYVGLYISVGNLLVLVLLTYELDKRSRIAERPIITFALDRQNGVFQLMNVGKSAALNIVVKSDIIRNQWKYAFHLYSKRPEDSAFLMRWTGSSMEICAEYTDIFGNKYISYMDDNRVRVIDLNSRSSKKQYIEELNKCKLKCPQPSWTIPL